MVLWQALLYYRMLLQLCLHVWLHLLILQCRWHVLLLGGLSDVIDGGNVKPGKAKGGGVRVNFVFVLRVAGLEIEAPAPDVAEPWLSAEASQKQTDDFAMTTQSEARAWYQLLLVPVRLAGDR
jgi:hypothetical protein